LQPAVDRYKEALPEEQSDFRSQLTDYVRLYSFLVQIITFVDTDLERLYVFCKYLLRALPTPDGQFPSDIQQLVDLDSYRVQQTSNGKIALQRQRGEIEPMRTKQTHLLAAEDMEPLSQIVRTLNEHFGLNLTEDDKISIRDLEGRLDESETLKASVRANASPENVRLTFQHEASQLLQGMIDSNLKFYKQANDDPDFQKTFFDMLFDRYMKKAKSA